PGSPCASHRTHLCVARMASALADEASRTVRPRHYAGAAASGDQASCRKDQTLAPVVGAASACVRPKCDYLVLYEICVGPRLRRQGFGTAIVCRLEERETEKSHQNYAYAEPSRWDDIEGRSGRLV